ncbi:MAG: PAS domain S-box protein [Opitutaceae bacterium]|nr:PAS domain S-box protein [Opitutaceae bacterium]
MLSYPAESKPAWLRLIGLTLAASVLVGGLCGLLYQRELAGIERRLGDREEARVGQLAFQLQRDLEPAADDLQILAQGAGLQAYLVSGLAADRERVLRGATYFSQRREDYYRIGFLDEHGREVLRVDQGGRVDGQLGDRSGDPGFGPALALGPGEIHVARFALEQGGAGPGPALVRFSTPVFDAAGRRRGVYYIDYLGDNVLARLVGSAPQLAHRLRLLDAGGHWLKAGDPAHEWGAQRPERAGYALARTDPALWQQLLREPQGRVRREGGLFSWQRVALLEPRRGGPARRVAEDSFLFVASQVSAEELARLSAGLRQIFLVVTPGLLLLAGGCVWFVDARRRFERALRRSEESLAVTLQSIGDAVLATDVAGRITRMNAVAEQLTGWRLDEARGRPIAEVFRIIHEETRTAAPIPVDAVLATGQIKGLANHTALIARDGRERPIADSAAPIRARDGRVLGVVLVFRDVTAERDAERALRTSEARYRTLFESIDEGFCVIELIFDDAGRPVDYRFLEVNPSFEKQSGLTGAVGRRMREFAPNLEAHWFEAFGRIALTGEPARFQNRAEPLGRIYDVYGFRFGDPARRQVAILFSDITRSKEAEERIVRLNTDLRVRAQELEAANKELESFSYSVSHDLRAPLRHVQGYVELLTREAQGQLSDKARRFLQTITDASREMGVLIDHLLEFSRMSRATLREEVVDLDAVVREVRAGLELALRDRPVEWRCPPLPRVRGDPVMLRQVYTNLVGNAVKYTRPRTPAVIEVGHAGTEQGRLVLFVRDNGVGFDMRHAEKLFGVFQRLHRADEFEGSGIGLANVQRIVTRHGGRVWAEARPGEGATFSFTLAPAESGPPAPAT